MSVNDRRHRSRALPSPEQSLEGAIIVAQNANDLLEASRGLGRAGLKGPAISLLVLALEEATKARALAGLVARSNSRELSDDELRAIIYGDHRSRHVAAFIDTVSGTTIAKLVKPKRRLTALQSKQVRSDLMAMKWHLEANSLKQRGLYVDFDGSEWHGPREIDSQQLARGLEIVGRFVQVTSQNIEDLDKRCS